MRLLRLILSGAFVCWSAVAADYVEFVHLSDTHLNSTAGIDPRIAVTLQNKKDTSAHMSEVLEKLRKVAPGFVVITGDLIDGYGFDNGKGTIVHGQIEVFQKFYDHSGLKIFPTLGNHDLTQYHHDEAQPKTPARDQSIAAKARQAWSRAVEAFHGGTYYAFSRKAGTTDYRFLMLDDGEAKGPAYAAKQLEWMKKEIANHGKQPVVIAMHIPVEHAPFKAGLMSLLADSPTVVLSIAGHTHKDGVDDLDLGSRHLTQIRTAALFISADNWRKYRLHPDRIEVFETSKPEELVKTLRVRSEGSTLQQP